MPADPGEGRGELQINPKVTIYPSMHHTIEFIKASGAGNDFVLIDNWNGTLNVGQPELAVALCSRPFGVGADGLLVLEKSPRANFQMRYYNADGSYGGMCGNGGRCIAMFAYKRGLAPRSMSFEALDHVYAAEVADQRVVLQMKTPVDFRPDVRLTVNGQAIAAQYINTGSPHVVVMVNNLESTDVIGLGRAIRHHTEFLPAGTNVNFLRLDGGDAIGIRTYERGVENETLACGTGSVASAVIAHLSNGIQEPVHVRVRSGEELLVHLKSQQGKVIEASLEGNAYILFSGKAFYDDDSHRISLPIESLQ